MGCKPEAREENALETAYQQAEWGGGWEIGDGDGGGVRSEGERLQDSGGEITCDARDKVRLRANSEMHLTHSRR